MLWIVVLRSGVGTWSLDQRLTALVVIVVVDLLIELNVLMMMMAVKSRTWS